MNVQVSTSDGSNVGSLENILGNTSISTLSSNKNLRVIGAFTDETNNRVYLFATDFSSEDPSARAASTNECKILELDLTNTTVSGTVDATATTGKGYTVTTTATTTQTTTSTTASTTPTTSGY
jgi:hypothetical protein